MPDWIARASAIRALGAALVAALAAACGGGGGDGGDAPPGPVGGAPTAYTLTVSGTPLTAAAQADDTRAVEHVFTPEGGTLVATGADGTVYTLHIPTGALPQGARVRMAPLAAVQVPGIDAEAGLGVDLGPAGLTFFVPAELTIEPPAGTAAALREQIPVNWSGAANTVSLAALDPTTAAIRLQVMHFSGYAILFSRKGMTSSLIAVRDRLGGSAEDRIASAAAEVLALERQRTQAGQADAATTAASLAALRSQFIDQVLKPRLAAAGSSCAAGRLAIQTLLGLSRQDALLGIADGTGLPAASNLMLADLLPQVAVVCMREEYEICRDEHLITRVLQAYLGIVRQAALLGLTGPDPGSAPPWLLEAEDYVRRCLQFELKFDSAVQLQHDRLPRHHMQERVESRVAIGYQMSFTEPPAGLPPRVRNLAALLFGMFRPLASRDYAVTLQEDCVDSVVQQPVGGGLGISFMDFVPEDPFGPRPAVTDVGLSLAFQPGGSSVKWQQSRRDPNGACANPQPQELVVNWFTGGLPPVAERFVTPDAGLYVTGWTVNHGSDILATKDLNLAATVNGDPATVSLNLVLFHTPL